MLAPTSLSFRAAGALLAALMALAAADHGIAGTIIKLDLGSDPVADVEFDGTTFSTVSDGSALTVGDQNTDIDYGDFLSANLDVLLSSASASLNGLTVAGAPTVIGGLIIQPFTGGTLALYDPVNTLLLSGTLANSIFSGPLGPPATGALFTTSFATVTGGALASQIAPASLSLSIALTDVNAGSGLSVTETAIPALAKFSADATLNIAAEPIPEPATLLLAGLGVAGMLAARRGR